MTKKFYVSIQHRLIGGTQQFTTSGSIEVLDDQGYVEAILILQKQGIRSGHEVLSVSASPEDEEPRL